MARLKRILLYAMVTILAVLAFVTMLIISSDHYGHTMANDRIRQVVGITELHLRNGGSAQQALDLPQQSISVNNFAFLIRAELHDENDLLIAQNQWHDDTLDRPSSQHTVRLTSLNAAPVTLTLHTNTADLIDFMRLQTLMRSLPQLVIAGLIILGWLYFNAQRSQFKIKSLVAEFARLRKLNDASLRLEPQKNGDTVGQLVGHINDLLSKLDSPAHNDETIQVASAHATDTQRLANFDSLTGLPNRQYILEHLKVELARAKRERRDLIVMFIDLDGFKRINDTMGHKAGDNVLASAAYRLNELIREGDTLARLGGDEFLLVPHNVVQDEVISLVAHKIVQTMGKPFIEDEVELHIGVSIGIARASQAKYDLSDLVSYADIAMYESKKAGKSMFTLFDGRMVEGHRRKLAIANSIPAALNNNQFAIAYQPKITASGKLIGFEALLRWEHHIMGNISPAEFVPIAESSGKIRDITLWVIAKVLDDTQSLIARFGAKIRIALNLSAIDLKNPSIADVLEKLRKAHKINACNIELEVTESAYLENFADTHRFFNRMADLGYHIALDDFGTGFSSLSYLTQIRVNTLKIDRQFVQSMEENERSALVTRSIIDLAKRLKLSICAEGIESASQFMRLAEAGCDVMQGYWFSKPLFLDAALELPHQFTDVERINKLATSTS